MKTGTKRVLSLLLAVVLTFSLGAAALATNTVPADALTLSGTGITAKESGYELQLYAGKSVQVTATVAPDDYDYGVTYKSDSDKVTVDVSGKITAVTATEAGKPANVTVTVVGKSDTTISKTIAVTVLPNAVKEVTISGTGVTAGKDFVMKKGATADLTATTSYLNGASDTENIAWSSSAYNVVSYSSTGRITAKTSGTAVITAASTVEGSTDKKATLNVNVYEVTGLTLTASGAQLTPNATFAPGYVPSGDTLTAIMSGVTYTSSNEAVATVDKTGKITDVGIGTTKITATLDGKTGTLDYTVSGVKIKDAPAAGTAVELIPGATKTFEAIYASDDKTAQPTWTVTGNGFEIVTGSAKDGKVTVKAKNDATVGDTATLTVRLGSASDSVTLKVVGAVDPTSISLNKTATTLAVGQTETINYTIAPANANYSKIEFTSSDPAVATVSNQGLVTALKAGTTTIKVVLTKTDGTAKMESTNSCTVTVKTASTTQNFTGTVKTGSRVTMSAIRTSMENKFTGTGTPTITLDLPSTTYYGTLYKSSSATASNKVESGVAYSMAEFAKMTLVTGTRTGDYTFTYTMTDGTVTMSGRVTITVGSSSADVTVTLTDTDTYAFNSTANKEKTSAYNAIRSAVYSVAGEYPTYIRFGTASGTTVGKLYDDDDDTVSRTTYYTMTELRGFTFEPAKKGTYSIPFTAYTSKSTSSSIATGTLEIDVTTGSSSKDTVTVTLDNAKDTYTFSEKTDEERTSAYNAIREYVYDKADEYPKYIEFGRATNNSVGTLYDDDEDTVSRNTRYSMSELQDFTFEPEKKGTYSIPFTAYSSRTTRNELCEGTLDIVVPGGNSGKGKTITVTLDDDSDYSFSDRTKADGTSAYTAIASAVKDYADESYEYLKFDSADTASSKIGTLYGDDDKTSISTNRKYYYDKSETYTVYDLFFVPKASTGTYERTFTAYNDDDDNLGTFTLEIVVGKGSSKSSGDIYANVAVSKTVTLGESMFTEWYKDQTGSGYKLAYVTFDDVDSSAGTFKHSSTSFDPDGDIKFYTDSYTGSTGSSAKYLKNVKYTASKSTGTIAVDFTCYGGTATNKANVEKEGTLYILVTDGDVKAVTYSVKTSAVTLSEKDFLSVYKTAMDTTSSSTKFYIELLGVPSKGTLYYDYSSASKPGTKLTSSNYDDYKLYVNGSSSSYGIDDITYVPATSATGAVSVDYIAYSTSGTPLYIGTLTFNYGTAAKTVTCYSDGYTFKATDFYSSADADPIKTVAFAQPAYGKLFMNYNNGYGTAVTANNSFYTAGSVKNASAISTVTYVPKAGFSGSVSVNYSAVTEDGVVVNGTMTINVKTKTASSTFTDVTASGVGSWAADSVDYAKAWGLVNGTGTTTFSPNATMTRAMLVTVLYRAAGSPAVSGTCQFTDVAKGQYYYDAVIWASKNGIANGVSATSFNPNGNVTREQVATLLYNFAKYKGISTTNSGSLSAYTDKGSVSSYATNAMTWAVAKGYITSTSTTAKVLSPASSATRAQVCVMLHRFLTDF